MAGEHNGNGVLDGVAVHNPGKVQGLIHFDVTKPPDTVIICHHDLNTPL